MATPKTTLVVGAGITGAAIAHLLPRISPTALQVIVWEQQSHVGGRMMARSFSTDPQVFVDVGCQYLTQLDSRSEALRDRWRQQMQLLPLDISRVDSAFRGAYLQQHEVASDPKGFAALVEDLLEDTTVQVNKQLQRFQVLEDNRLTVFATDGESRVVHQLVLACPAPNLMAILQQSSFQLRSNLEDALKKVTYSQRFALAYLFDGSQFLHERVDALGWIAKFVSRDEDQVVRFVCWDSRKKKTTQMAGALDKLTLLVHTSVPFGSAHMEDTDEEIMTKIDASVRKLLPFLPTEQDRFLHRWRISQVQDCLNGRVIQDSGLMTLSDTPRIIAAGDMMSGSHFDSCVVSAQHAATFLTQ